MTFLLVRIVIATWLFFGQSLMHIALAENCVDPSKAARTTGEIQCTVANQLPRLMRHQASLDDPNQTANGRVTVGLEILPSGQVKNSWVVYSELENTILENTVLDAVNAMDFGAKETSASESEVSIEFVQGKVFF